VIESQTKAKSKITWKRQVSDPLGKGNGSTHLRQKPYSNKERKPPNQSSNTTKNSPCTYASSPWAKAHSPLNKCSNATRSKNCSLCPGRLDCLHQVVRPPTTHLTAWWRLDRPKRPALHQTAQNLPEPIGTPSKHSQVPKACTNFSLLLTMHESRQNAKLYNI
jgi:hypothetical protein